MTDKNTMIVTYDAPGTGDEFGKHYKSGKNLRCWLNGDELVGIVDFKYEVGINDFMMVTLKFLVAEMEIKGNDTSQQS